MTYRRTVTRLTFVCVTLVLSIGCSQNLPETHDPKEGPTVGVSPLVGDEKRIESMNAVDLPSVQQVARAEVNVRCILSTHRRVNFEVADPEFIQKLLNILEHALPLELDSIDSFMNSGAITLHLQGDDSFRVHLYAPNYLHVVHGEQRGQYKFYDAYYLERTLREYSDSLKGE